ncbi:ABC transporter permease [Schlesneria paludicola]|uniref:ABC transporter permease n=1 Tax=Schlesneria paludicola TaxID=360056 RepID=UPI00029AB5EA|nr:ABC transporter permease subunit [Schlesneria paludicola]
MLPGIWALLERSLRIDARSLSPHLVRFGLLVTIYITLCFVNEASGMFGAPGLHFFQSMTFLNLTFMTLFGVSYFSSSITEEKEEETLGLMLMAGISPLGILLGKSGGRLVHGSLLIAAQYPFTLLAVTLGGILTPQIQAVYLAMFAYLAMVAGLGVLCSTLCQTSRAAATRMTILLAVYFLLPLCSGEILRSGRLGPSTWRDVLTWITDVSILSRFEVILASGFQGELFSRQVISNGLVGAGSVVLSWLGLIHVVKNLSPRVPTSSRTLRKRWFWRVMSPGRIRGNPFSWKDFHFSAGGWPAILFRSALYLTFFSGIFALIMTVGQDGSNRWNQGYVILYAVFMIYAITFDAGLLVSRCLHDEVRGQTLTSLALLPELLGEVLYFKLIGSLTVWLPGPLLLACGVAVIPEGLDVTANVFENAGIAFVCVMHLLLVPHAAAVAALYVRWGALALGICASVCSFVVMILSAEFLASPVNAGSSFFVMFGFLLIVVCAGCHLAVRLRAESLAARS